MFTQFKNIDTAFQHIKRFSIYLILANVLILCFGIYKSYEFANKAQSRIHILYNGKVLEAIAADRKSNIPVELRDHIKTFHQYFFSMDPDEKAILSNMTKALYLADESAKRQYDNLKESGYYSNLISANISQEIEVDSIALDLNAYPYQFRCYATQKLIRSSSTVLRKLVTTGEVRDLKSQTDNNPHGFLIQRWETISNLDVPLNL
ncbi:conjugative transposon protein TraK [Pedobacter gandavensis]|uniref:Conjugative transposon protein TraK n=1 Tax=Pedobacter gandavensis TaxID=2679963 RepID=A0ABR6EQ44_9SPHI|nr:MULTISPECIES: conjugative transposon protein TraK [Pedobacter]MBB2147355.1 conjugative transposon protein TraK [Pedobacter gandavensis]WGQ09914.1 conjugative transposon protein TraK [Pedobacter gandavensis]